MSARGSRQPAQSPDSRSNGEPTVVAIIEPPERLTRLDRVSLALLAIAFVLFSGLVQFRSALCPPRRLGDWNVFARAAWAARTGGDLYAITDDKGFHYLYPPTFAILLAPLADAPAGASRDGLLPYPITVLYWYFFNVACLALSAHWLASAVEGAATNRTDAPPMLTRRWWGLRLWPVLACLPPLGHTLVRGQVGVLLLLFLSGMIACVVRGKSARAGGWLACAICLKVIPALLIVYPLLRRDYRFLFGCAAGLFAGLIVLPMAARGPRQAWNDYRSWNQVMLAPVLAGGTDTSRSREVLDVIATDSQSFLAMFHNTRFLDRSTRPRQASSPTRLAALAASAALLAALMVLSRRVSPHDAPAKTILWGALIEVMLLASPVCHLHYFCLSIPLVAGIVAATWEGAARPRLGILLSALFAVNIAANTLPHFPGMEMLRDVGLAGYGALLLLAAGALILWRRGGTQARAMVEPTVPIQAAA